MSARPLRGADPKYEVDGGSRRLQPQLCPAVGLSARLRVVGVGRGAAAGWRRARLRPRALFAAGVWRAAVSVGCVGLAGVSVFGHGLCAKRTSSTIPSRPAGLRRVHAGPLPISRAAKRCRQAHHLRLRSRLLRLRLVAELHGRAAGSSRASRPTRRWLQSECPALPARAVLSDRIGFLPVASQRRNRPGRLREVRVRSNRHDPAHPQHDLDAPAQESPISTRRRWAIELFFRLVKQMLDRRFVASESGALSDRRGAHRLPAPASAQRPRHLKSPLTFAPRPL